MNAPTCTVSPTHAPELHTLTDEATAELAYIARRDRLVHPHGRFDSAGRFYPNEDSEGGTPDVRSPSRAYPYSYMVACRSRGWCADLPPHTQAVDAAVALNALRAGRVDLSERRNARLRRLMSE